MTIVDSLSRDVRHASRALRRDLGAALLVAAIAGLGIGASTAVFTQINAVFWKTLPVDPGSVNRCRTLAVIAPQ